MPKAMKDIAADVIHRINIGQLCMISMNYLAYGILHNCIEAKTIYDTYCPDNGLVLDISVGFGQRMLGAAASKKVKHYVGIDPWKRTIDSVNMMKDEVKSSAELICIGSELFDSEQEFDLCFSSPPFYDKEIYNDDHRKWPPPLLSLYRGWDRQLKE